MRPVSFRLAEIERRLAETRPGSTQKGAPPGGGAPCCGKLLADADVDHVADGVQDPVIGLRVPGVFLDLAALADRDVASDSDAPLSRLTITDCIGPPVR
jgi:hypothetical protein